MSWLINLITVVKPDVVGICQVKNVVNGVVTRWTMHLLRVLGEARYLLARLLRSVKAGRLALASCQFRPAAHRTRWASEPTRSGIAHLCRDGHLSRPRSANGMGGF